MRLRLLFGAHVPPDPSPGMAALACLEASLGQPLDILHFYQAWGGDFARFRTGWLDLAAAGGRRVLLTWEPWNPGGPPDQAEFWLSRLLSGRYDGYIAGWGAALASRRHPIYLRPMHEMNYPAYPWSAGIGDNTPELFMQAWRHLHELVSGTGARNVRWVWSPLVDGAPGGADLKAYYPGDNLVDVIGLDGYNWGNSVPGYAGGWRTFEEVFGHAYTRVREIAPAKPVWIAEAASDEAGGDKAAWIASAFETIDARMPAVEALVWFHVDKERRWRIDSSPEALDALRTALARGRATAERQDAALAQPSGRAPATGDQRP
ncbi:MAG: glycoside hydrolase family 26 protein [Actinomycetota bacterium]